MMLFAFFGGLCAAFAFGLVIGASITLNPHDRRNGYQPKGASPLAPPKPPKFE